MENLDIDKFLDNDYDTIAKPDYSSLSLKSAPAAATPTLRTNSAPLICKATAFSLTTKKGFTGSSRLRRRTHRRVCESWHLLPYRARYSQKL